MDFMKDRRLSDGKRGAYVMANSQTAYLIGIDIGTSGTKTVLFDQNCRPIASAVREYPLYQPHNGWAEQDPGGLVAGRL